MSARASAERRSTSSSNFRCATNGAGEAYYRLGDDFISLPRFEAFKSAAHFYGVAFHELGHWTGHNSRLDRDLRSRRIAGRSSPPPAGHKPRPIIFAVWRCAMPNRQRREGAVMRAHSSATAASFFDVDWINGRSVEVFYADEELARAFDGSAGWYWWACYPGCLPGADAFGPFPTSYRALKDAFEHAQRRA
jgi:hypothetical protein